MSERQAVVRKKLALLATWTAEELEEEFSKWSDEEILDLWSLLEPTFRLMCLRFGLMQLHRRIRVPHLHQQINRLDVLQRFAEKANNNSHERTTTKEA